MTGLFEGVALRGAGLLTQAGAVAVQPRPAPVSSLKVS